MDVRPAWLNASGLMMGYTVLYTMGPFDTEEDAVYAAHRVEGGRS